MELRRRRPRFNPWFCLFYFFFFYLLCSSLLQATIHGKTPCSEVTRSSSQWIYCHSQGQGGDGEQAGEKVRSVGWRRGLSGPGSWPPRCKTKCGKCSPCIPVHVPVPPGTPVTTEYYPEAWRCKCGNKLYMP